MIEQNGVNSVEREENYVPRTRKDYGLPAERKCIQVRAADIGRLIDESPRFAVNESRDYSYH